MMKRYAGLLSLVVALSGCWGSPTSRPVNTAVTADTQVISASNVTSGGSLQISIVPMDGTERSVAFTPRGKTVDDIKGYIIQVIESDDAVRYQYKYAGTKRKFRIENLPVKNAGGDSLRVRIQAFSDETWTQNITDGQMAVSTVFTLKDQELSTTSVTLKLLDGATANGDVTTTVDVLPGVNKEPVPTIDFDLDEDED